MEMASEQDFAAHFEEFRAHQPATVKEELARMYLQHHLQQRL